MTSDTLAAKSAPSAETSTNNPSNHNDVPADDNEIHSGVGVLAKTVKLLDAEGTEVARIATDEFGEFRFKELDEQAYTVAASVDGYEDIALSADATDKDVVLGDIFLSAVA